MTRPLLCSILLFVMALIPAHPAAAQAVPVELVEADDGSWQLMRGGEPYRIRGAGGHEYLDQLAAAGGNTIRTWGVDEDTGDLLDAAHAQGLAVVVGIWLGHERHGFDYTDLGQVAAQQEAVRAAVLEHRDHPAVLMWALGNEMEGYDQGDNAAIWSHINSLAQMVDRLDPHHPTTTVITEVGGRRVEALHRLAPAIDVVGINSYAGAPSLPERYRQAGGTKPYMVAEFGPHGTWEIQPNAWGAVPEPTSTDKAEAYARSYAALEADAELNLGSFAFVWGNKQEATATWFGMFLPDGTRLAAVDAMTEGWTGQAPDDQAPRIESLELQGPSRVQPGADVQLTLDAADPEGATLQTEWFLKVDPMDYAFGGDAQAVPPRIPEALVSSDAGSATFRMPERGGAYRAFVIVRDGSGRGATANVPLYVEGPAGEPDAAPVTDAGGPAAAGGDDPGPPLDLPVLVFGESGGQVPWVPSGYMGNGEAISMDPGSTANPRTGRTALRAAYRANDGWGGVVWQHPANDWGDQPGGFDLSGARALTFWARGEAGGETVNFGLGVLGDDATHHDSGSAQLENVQLTPEWNQYRIPLNGVDLTRIKTGFFWSTASRGQPVVFFLDDIRYE